MEEEQARDYVVSELQLEGGGNVEGRAHVAESSRGQEIAVAGPNTTGDVAAIGVLVNNEPTVHVEQRDDELTPAPVPVGVASPHEPNQSSTEE